MASWPSLLPLKSRPVAESEPGPVKPSGKVVRMIVGETGRSGSSDSPTHFQVAARAVRNTCCHATM